MDISEQVKELRKAAKWFEGTGLPETIKLVNDAADTIESLSAKLQAANMERSAEDCGGWIPCSERLPEKNGNYLCTMWSGEVMICEYGWNGPKTKRDFFRNYCAANVIAWREMPEPYHKP